MWEVAFETGFKGWVGVGIGPNGREGGMVFQEEEEYGRNDDTGTRVKQRDNNFVWWVRGNSEGQGCEAERSKDREGPDIMWRSLHLSGVIGEQSSGFKGFPVAQW